MTADRAPANALTRFPLVSLPTPLQRLERFGEAIGCELWIKRDDIGSPALAGNKVRKLEVLLAQPDAAESDTLVTSGGAQSNSARAVAAVAAMTGRRCVLVLAGEPRPATANLLLDRLFGAQVVWAGSDEWADLDRALSAAVERVREYGGTPLRLPVGCSTDVGALGFVAGYNELLEQLDATGVEAEAVVVASSSGGTVPGLAVGRALRGRGPTPYAFGVAPSIYPDIRARYRETAVGALALLEADGPVDERHLELDWSEVGGGYGAPTVAAVDAIRLLARTEAIVCDPVYTGKALAGLVRFARARRFSGPVVFWHTGGYHAIFDHIHGNLVASDFRGEAEPEGDR